MGMKWYDKLAIGLLIVGGLNWLLSIWDINLVTKLLGNWPNVVTAVYVLVGAAAVYTLIWFIKQIKK